MDKDKIKHMDYIETCIARLSQSAFHLKELAVILATGLLTFSLGIMTEVIEKQSEILLIGIIPMAILWIMDSMYLNKERKYRDLYNDVIGLSGKECVVRPFDMSISQYRKGIVYYIRAMFSTSEWIYIALILVVYICYIMV